MAGGSEEAFARALPLLSLMGGNIHHVGPVSSGQIAKIANQIIVALSIEAVSEALVFARRAGVDPDKVRRALQQGFAGSRVLEVHGKRMIERSFEPGFRIELHRKDLGLALQAAQELDLALPNTAATEAMLSSCIAAGEGGLDHSALIRAIERLSGAVEMPQSTLA
jgi:2-hydroxy-3-oxopropionate reductase